MTTHERERGRVRLYACGGGGINMGHKIDHLIDKSNEVFAHLDVVYLDTSKSNLHSDITQESVYLIEGVDGSGQVRKENHAVIAERCREILQTFKPADLNIMLSTGSGGTGSVLAPLLTSEQLAKDCPVVVICIGDDSTRKYTENTLNTLKSYDQIAKLRKHPVIMAYIQNSSEMTRAVVDERVQHLVSALCILFSRRNRELDSKDLYYWLNYHDVTSHQPALTALTLIDDLNPGNLSRLGNLISIATLTIDGTDPTLPARPEIQYVGYLDQLGARTLDVKAPFHYITSDGVFADVAANLNSVLKEVDEQSSARVRKNSISNSADQATDSGLVL